MVPVETMTLGELSEEVKMGKVFKQFGAQFILIVIILSFMLTSCFIQPVQEPQSEVNTSRNQLIVSITSPIDNEAYPISAGLSIRGEALSDSGIDRMELWSDGLLYETFYSPERGLKMLTHSWVWSPKLIGGHTLLVRAYDEQNRSGISNVVHIKGIQDPGMVLITRAGEKETLSDMAQRYDVSPDLLSKVNGDIHPTEILVSGTEVFIPMAEMTLTSSPPAGGKSFLKLSSWLKNFKSGLILGHGAVLAPSLSLIGGNCAAELKIGDQSEDEQGFNIYRLDPGDISFKKIATLPANQGNTVQTYQDVNLYGAYQYYVEVFNGSAFALSDLASISVIDADCVGTQVKIDSLAFIPVSVEEYYLYIMVNGGDWRRFPADEFTYLKRSDNLDFNQIVPKLVPGMVGKITLKGEVWGLLGETATLLGSFEKIFDPQPAPAIISPNSLGTLLTTKLEVRGVFDVSLAKYPWFTEKGVGLNQEVFRFGTDTDADYGIWQVASSPFGKNVSFNPECLLLTGKANGTGTHLSPFEFGIDLTTLKPTVDSVTLTSFENAIVQTPIFNSPVSTEKLDYTPQQVVNKPLYGAGVLGVVNEPFVPKLGSCSMNVSTEGIISYYARVIPMKNGQASGKPSNTVILNYDPNGQISILIPTLPIPSEPYYQLEIVNFTGVHVPEAKYEFCVQIVENNNSLFPYKQGDILCPEVFKGGSQNSLMDAIESAYNFIANAYKKLSDWVTTLVEELNPLCIQAKLATTAINTGEAEVKDACHFIAVFAVAAAKTYVGLPPSLPNFDQLTELGKENLVELAAQELENNGVPCPKACKDVIREGIETSLNEIEKNMSNSSCVGEVEAHENGVEPLCLPVGVTSKPDPRGQPAPAIVEIKVTRLMGTTGTGFPETESCKASVNVYAKNDSHIGQNFGSAAGFAWQGAPIEGNLMSGNAGIASLSPGESIQLPVIMSPTSFWLAGHKEFVKAGWKAEHYDDWSILYDGAMATISAGGVCSFDFPEGKGFSEKSFVGDKIDVGPLGNAWNQTCHPYNCP